MKIFSLKYDRSAEPGKMGMSQMRERAGEGEMVVNEKYGK